MSPGFCAIRRPPAWKRLTSLVAIGVVTFLMALTFPCPAWTEEALIPATTMTPAAAVEREELVRGEERRTLNVYTGFRIVSQYVSRGLVFSDQPAIQPWIEIDIPVMRYTSSSNPLDTLTVFAGTWSNVNLAGSDDGRARTGRAAMLKDWYEADLYGGLRIRVSRDLLISMRYNYYSSPSNSFRDIHELDWRISYNDAPLWDGVGLQLFPALRIAKEFHDMGGPDNLYFQPSLTPTLPVSAFMLPMTFQVPLILGFGANDQYLEANGDEHYFGFFQTGLKAAIDLKLLPDIFGSLTVSLGIDYVVLADDGLGLEGDGTETVGSFGINYGF